MISVTGGLTLFLLQWQRAIASQPVTCVQGFLLGGSAWLAIPLGEWTSRKYLQAKLTFGAPAFASTLGLAARALQYSPTWPGYPNVLTENEIGSGLPAPAVRFSARRPPAPSASLTLPSHRPLLLYSARPEVL